MLIGTALAALAGLIVAEDKPLRTVGGHQGILIAGVAEAVKVLSR